MRRIGAAFGGFGVGAVEVIVSIDIDAAGARELCPLFEELAVLIEDLNAIVPAVADKEASLGIKGERVRHFELARAAAMAAPLLDEFAVFGELENAGVIAAGVVSVADEDVAVRCNRDGVGLVQCIRAVAGN